MRQDNLITNAQSKAIQHGTGPMLVIAGPGSGKTFVITHRISHLIQNLHIEPKKILVITFTKAAAMEMQERFVSLGIEGASQVCFGTFHAIFYAILKNHPRFHFFKVITETEKAEIIQQILLKMQNEGEQDLIAPLISEISRCKNLGISPMDFQSELFAQEQFQSIFEMYHQNLNKLKKLDFDDMLLQCKLLLEQDRSYLEQWQSRFMYILIDEYQDINPLQFEVIQLLTAKHHNLFVVGDDDQAIYGFRGSKPEIMLRFRDYYPEAQLVTLCDNFRSGKDIVKKAGRLITNNKKRYEKYIVSKNLHDHKVKAIECDNRQMQAEQLVLCIQQYMKREECRYDDIAILYRTNSHIASLIEKLIKAKIPFSFQEKVQNIYDTDVGKDMIAYLRYAAFENDVKDFYRIMNKPVRYIKRNSVPLKSSFHRSELIKNQTEKYVIHNIIQMYDNLSFLKDMSPFAAINYVRKAIGYDEYLQEIYQGNALQKQQRIEILDELQDCAREFETIPEWLGYITELRERWSRKDLSEEHCVKIMSMHAAKGLEWKVVLLPDLNESYMPHKKAISEEEMEEERRILYVAMTRAKEYLFLFFVQYKEMQFKAPSRFLKEIFDQD